MPKTKRDWLEAGLAILVSSGVADLTIERLCQILEMTKGSFYHHFKSLQDYKEQLLAYWSEVDTQQVVEAAGSVGEGAMGVDGLIQVLGSRAAETANPELAIRAWARQDESVHAFVEQIDTTRIAMTQSMLQEVVDNQERAYLLARMLYAMLVGSYSIIPPVEKEAVLGLYVEFKKLLA